MAVEKLQKPDLPEAIDLSLLNDLAAGVFSSSEWPPTLIDPFYRFWMGDNPCDIFKKSLESKCLHYIITASFKQRRATSPHAPLSYVVKQYIRLVQYCRTQLRLNPTIQIGDFVSGFIADCTEFWLPKFGWANVDVNVINGLKPEGFDGLVGPISRIFLPSKRTILKMLDEIIPRHDDLEHDLKEDLGILRNFEDSDLLKDIFDSCALGAPKQVPPAGTIPTGPLDEMTSYNIHSGPFKIVFENPGRRLRDYSHLTLFRNKIFVLTPRIRPFYGVFLTHASGIGRFSLKATIYSF